MKLSLAVTTLSLAVSQIAASLSPRSRALRERAEENETGWRRRRMASVDIVPVPSQTFYVPLPEKSLLDDAFHEVWPASSGPVISIVALSINTDNTVIWYDHYEDGFEEDILKPVQSSTLIFGDGNSETGCLPWVVPCTDEADVLIAGQSIVLQNNVDVNDPTAIKFGASDKIQASFPIAITRGAYPEFPGPYLAGAVEVLDTNFWGTHYEAALASDADEKDYFFEYVVAYVMAAKDNTTLTYPDGTTGVLHEGEGASIYLPKLGQQFYGDKPLQVDLLTGDAVSVYEMRWFTLRPTSAFSREYWSPVGVNEKDGGTKVVVYNPNDAAITVTYEDLNKGKNRFRTMSVASKGIEFTGNIPSGSGVRLFSDLPFIAFAIIDTREGGDYDGQVYDWGFPLVPVEYMTPIVLVGWGYGCADLDCDKDNTKDEVETHSRSVVWVTPYADCDMYVDYDNDGSVDNVKNDFLRLQSKIFKEESDDDMSGSVIWATKLGSGPEGPPVLLAAAWGQDPRLSENSDNQALDLGTVVLPFSGISATKFAELESDALTDAGGPYEGMISHGDTIRYVITVTNVGVLDLVAQSIMITDQLDEHVDYVRGSTEYWSPQNGIESVVDSPNDEGFPLTDGIRSKALLERRGQSHEISFLVTIKTGEVMVGVPFIYNSGLAVTSGVAEMSAPFENTVRLPPSQRSTVIDTAPPTDLPTLAPDESDETPVDGAECPDDEFDDL